jgi:acyl-CoA synthetase (AMP-forming)/AMP-acid ligase II
MSAAATAPAEPAALEAPPPSTPAPAPAGSVVWSTAEPPPPADVTAAGRSVYELFLSGAAKDRDAPALGFRAPAPAAPGPYAWLSYGEVGDTVLAAAASLLADTALAPGDRVGIYGKNAPSWIVALLAISAAGMVAVPLYDSLGVGAVQYVCNHSAVKAAFVAEEQLPVFAESWPEAPTVARVIAFGPAGVAAPAPALPPAAAADPRVVTLAAFVAAAPVPLPDLPGPDVDADFVCLYATRARGGRPRRPHSPAD